MTTYYYFIDSGTVDSTTSINVARKKSVEYLEKHPKGNGIYHWAEIYTGLTRPTVYGYVVKGIRNYDGYVFCNKNGMEARIIKKDGSLCRRV